MALLLKRLFTGYIWLFDEMADPRFKEYAFLSSPLEVVAITGAYLYFVFVIGPKIMKNREPLQLKTTLVLYNLTQIIFNLIILYKVRHIIKLMNLDCNLVDYSQRPKGKLSLEICYLFYLLKVYDLLDTIFIVLRKNMRQANFLHVYHHSMMVIATYSVVAFFAGGEVIWTGVLNAAVHAVMYLYYLLSSLDSEWAKNLSGKKFLTQLQLAQFVANIFIYGRLLFKHDCPYPSLVPIIYLPQNIFMLALFGDFYIKTYLRKKPKSVQ